MAIEAITQVLQAQIESAQPPREINAGYGAGLADAAQFEQSYANGSTSQPAGAEKIGAGHGGLAAMLESGPIGTMLGPLQRINLDAQKLSGQTPGGTMLPSEMMTLTIRSHEFLFHCELTSNVANRTSDGVQQLFRQQS